MIQNQNIYLLFNRLDASYVLFMQLKHNVHLID